MKNETNTPETDNIPPYATADWLLQDFVMLANYAKLEIGITLNISGQTISGTLISGKNYFNELAKSIATALEIEEEKMKDNAFTKSILDHKEIYNRNEDEEKPDPQFIHLKNARVFRANDSIPTSGSLWRGRITCVSGFHLGMLSAAD